MAIDKGKPTPPPADLHARALPLDDFTFENWRRIHRADKGACYYSEDSRNRFSSPGCKVIYVGDSATTVFWEIYWDELGAVAPPFRQLDRAKLAARKLSSAAALRHFKLFNATKVKSLRTVSANAAAFMADYDNCQAWAKALMSHTQKPDGLIYPSVRNAGGVCVALFEGRTSCADITFSEIATLDQAQPILSLITKEKIGVPPF